MQVGKIEYAPDYGMASSPAAVGKLALATNNDLPRIVAFTGVAGSGKSTASRHLVEKHGYQLVKFAGPLKDMLRAIGLGDVHIEGPHKETGIAILSGRTPRHAMQTLGTEWGRKCMGDDFWINLWRTRVDGILAFNGRVVVDDCRFPNEATAVRKMGGDIYRIVGRGGISGGHESERQEFEFDCLIENDGPLQNLHGAIDAALGRYL